MADLRNGPKDWIEIFVVNLNMYCSIVVLESFVFVGVCGLGLE